MNRLTLVTAIVCAGATTFSTAQPDRYRTRQHVAPSQDDFGIYGVNPEVIIISGGTFVAHNRIVSNNTPATTLDEFIAASYGTLLNKMTDFRDDNLHWTQAQAEAFDGIVIMDIEGEPNLVNIAGFNLDPTSAYFNTLVAAYQLRTSVTAEIFPNATLGIWGVGAAPNNGFTSPDRVDIWREFATRHTFDDITYAVPPMYARWCDDDVSQPGTGGLTDLATRYEDIAHNTLDQLDDVFDGLTYLETSAPVPALIPLPAVTGRIYNHLSTCHETLLTDFDPGYANTLIPQLEVLETRGSDVLFWNNGFASNDAERYAYSLFYCRGNQRYADSVLNQHDYTDFLTHYSEMDPLADVNRDGSITALDLQTFLGYLSDPSLCPE